MESGFLSRPFYCPNHRLHEEATRVVVFGSTRKQLIVYDIEHYIIDNITPHIISYNKEIESNIIDIVVTCGIVGCGVDFKEPNDLSQGFIFNEVKTRKISINNWVALFNFKNTGFEI